MNSIGIHWCLAHPQIRIDFLTESNGFRTESVGFHTDSLVFEVPWIINEFHKNSYDSAVWRIPGTCQGVWWSNWKRRSVYGLDSSNDSNDTLESRYAPRNPRSCSGFRFAEVLLIGCSLDSAAWILESGPRAANRWWREIQHCSGGRWGIPK